MCVELGVNFEHIKGKSLSVLNPFREIDKHIMDDTDLAGPFFFCLLFASCLVVSGKFYSGYIYGMPMLGWLTVYIILNLMSETAIDLFRTASVLGYCILPMVLLAVVSIFLELKAGLLGVLIGIFTILWCTYASSTMFVTVLDMKDQRILIAYPIGLLYTCFALLSIF